MSGTMRSLNDILLDRGLVTPAQLEYAFEEHQRRGAPVGRVLVDQGVLSEAHLVAALATQLGMDYVDLDAYPVDERIASLVPAELCRRHTVLPIGIEDARVVVAMADPGNVFALDDIRSATGRDVRAVVATRIDVERAISRYAHGTTGTATADQSLVNPLRLNDPDPLNLSVTGSHRSARRSVAPAPLSDEANAARLVDAMLEQALRDRVSDLHVEPGTEEFRVRFRIDGVLHEVLRSPMGQHAEIVNILADLARVDISESSSVGHGVIAMPRELAHEGAEASFLPTMAGIKVTVAFSNTAGLPSRITELGLSVDELAVVQDVLARGQGMVLCAGPPRSGRTTNALAMLADLAKPECNAVSVETRTTRYVDQVAHIERPQGIEPDFIRAVGRSKVDVLHLGDLTSRDLAKAATEVALGGCTVLASMNAIGAPEAVSSLTQMGVDPTLVAASVTAVVSSRLCRKLCHQCAEAVTIATEELVDAGYPETLPTDRLMRARGCTACSHTGFRGVFPLFEVMVISERIGRLLAVRAPSGEIAKVALGEGMATVRASGWEAVAEGKTTLNEVLRVTQ